MALTALGSAGHGSLSVIGWREITLFKKLSSIVFALAFVASGWNSVIAATLCPHQECMGRPAAEEHHVTRESEEPAKEHCSSGVKSSGHESHLAADDVTTEQPSGRYLRGTGGHTQSCIHCMGAPQAPAKSSFGVTAAQNQTRRDADADAPHITKEPTPAAVASFPALRPTQGSPPHPAQRRHLLIHVFLI